MAKSIIGTTKKRGRPASTGKGQQIGMRWQAAELSAIDAWSEKQIDAPSRPEAIRRLVDLGLTVKVVRKASASQRTRASDMAGAALDKMADAGASDEEKATRKRRLLKGPSEFREVRKDRKPTK